MPGSESPDGCVTDPEPGMDSRRATVRNMRSKCRCSCVLQFTFRRAVSCVLHRPPSQVIHCIVLCFRCLREELGFENTAHTLTSRRGEHTTDATRGEGRGSLRRLNPPSGCWNGAPHPTPEPADARPAPNGTGRRTAVEPPTGGSEAPGRVRGGPFPRLCISSRSPPEQGSIMILPQVHLRKPCYDFYFL